MASTNFIDGQTVIVAAWLNDVNALVYDGTFIGPNLTVPGTLTAGAIISTGTGSFGGGGTFDGIVESTTGGFQFPDGTIQTTSYQSANGAIVENNQTITANYTITTGKNGMSAGPITIDTGVSVTVPTDSTWVIV